MALIQWKQINPQLLGNGQLTGSLEVSGSIILNGVNISAAAGGGGGVLPAGVISSSLQVASYGYATTASLQSITNRLDLISGVTGSHLTDLSESDLQDLRNINIDGIANGQILAYDSASGTFIPTTAGQGDITAVYSGVGLEGGGTTGVVALEVKQGEGILANNQGVHLDTGSQHFISGVNTAVSADYNRLINVPTLISGSNQVVLTGVEGFTGYSGSVANAIAQERERIDTMLSASTLDKDSFAEIVSFIEGANLQDLQNLTAFITSSNNRDEALEQSVNLLSSSIAANIATISSSLLSGVLPGSGLQSNNDPGTVTLSVDTGSQHFITGVIDLNVFKQVGSYYSTTNDLQVTGSLTLRKDESGDALSVYSGSAKTFGITDTGILRFTSQSTTPVPVAGGMYFDSNFNLFIGQE